MRKTFITSVLFVLLSLSTAFSAPTICPEHFANGQAPDLINQKLSSKSKDICYSAFALKHSGITRTPLYAAEHLSIDSLSHAKGLKRSNKFYPDPNLFSSDRAELRHYARSGYDRGHVAPAGDMPSPGSKQECFTLANMIPQVPSVNRGVWEGVESSVRKLAKARGDLYIVTGPIYSGNSIQRIGGAVMVPTQTFKAVYDPSRNEAGAYLVDNVVGATVQIISIAELDKISGISVFPSINSQVKSNGMRLPEPKERKHRGGRS
ncbi:MAG: DNA/RNA non-specific endonuclease [Desulfuromonadaceae bacterium]|nr:DNA/RNA non-specific endonuclease [Desulfuromonadaceae bacterium]MDD2847627.1 DNA/RNA non-specific endonuclease [Desulfuromonadaceae bacterium]MDD4131127.1 DNA/RNA non-specific endonuclease [Desulfuromonadaceae bacterium]